MSTRCQILMKQGSDTLWFYRHCDGYPEGVKPTLDTFCKWLKDGLIRKDLQQASGWLVILGHLENKVKDAPIPNDPYGWEVGSYEPCPPERHGDIDHLYEIDIDNAAWREIPL